MIIGVSHNDVIYVVLICAGQFQGTIEKTDGGIKVNGEKIDGAELHEIPPNGQGIAHHQGGGGQHTSCSAAAGMLLIQAASSSQVLQITT